MIGIRFILLVLHALEVLTSPSTAVGLMNGGIHLQPVEYSWIAHLEYGREYNEQCIGSVISDRHVLTYSQCVTKELTLVRLGDMSMGPHFLKYFAIESRADTHDLIPNNLALLRLNDTTLSGLDMMRVRLPIRMPQLTELGYFSMINLNELTAKRVVIIPILNKIECEIQSSYMMCTGIYATNADNMRDRFSADPPILNGLNPKKIVTNGIRSIVHGSTNYSDLYTELYTFIKNGRTVPILGQRFRDDGLPTDCGKSPIYPRELMDGGYKIEPDEFSWLARLAYGTSQNSSFGNCSGSVITSRYVLTAARCIYHSNLGQVVAVHLGDFSGKSFCDYGVESCRRYQRFLIESYKIHENYRPNAKRMNDIALLKLKGNIEFGDNMTPICLPFGKNTHIGEPELDSFLTVAGWWTTTFPSDSVAKRSEAVAFWNTTGCMEADRDKNTQICGVRPGRSPCTTEFGSPLMNMFERRRMVLEGIAYDGVAGCPGKDVGTLYTNVREYGEWIVNSISLLDRRITHAKSPPSWSSLFNRNPTLAL